jgi:selenocysteine-specific elongation factor
VLDPAPRRHGPSRALLARLVALERGEEPAAPPPRPTRRVVAAPPPLTDSARAAEARLREAGAEPPLDSEFEPADLAALRAHGRAARLGPSMHVHTDALAAVCAQLIAVIERDGSITLAGARDALKTSRKYAQAYLEHLDAERVTLRRGDVRVLRRRRSQPADESTSVRE